MPVITIAFGINPESFGGLSGVTTSLSAALLKQIQAPLGGIKLIQTLLCPFLLTPPPPAPRARLFDGGASRLPEQLGYSSAGQHGHSSVTLADVSHRGETHLLALADLSLSLSFPLARQQMKTLRMLMERQDVETALTREALSAYVERQGEEVLPCSPARRSFAPKLPPPLHLLAWLPIIPRPLLFRSPSHLAAPEQDEGAGRAGGVPRQVRDRAQCGDHRRSDRAARGAAQCGRSRDAGTDRFAAVARRRPRDHVRRSLRADGEEPFPTLSYPLIPTLLLPATRCILHHLLSSFPHCR